jgi:hypothetical protein
MSYNKNKEPLRIDTDLEEDNNNIVNNNIVNNNIVNNNIVNNSNQFRFKTYVNGIIEIQNLQDFIIRLSLISGLFMLACPRFFTEIHFLNAKTSHTTDIEIIYFQVSICETILLSTVTYYLIMSEDLDGIYDITRNKNTIPNLIMLGKIEKFWCKYYSWIGVTIAALFYCNNKYITASYMYILGFSIFRLSLLRYFENKKLSTVKN